MRYLERADTQSYLDELKKVVPEMPWATVARLAKKYHLEHREVETLIGLDEFTGAGVKYFETVAGGDPELGKKASNW